MTATTFADQWRSVAADSPEAPFLVWEGTEGDTRQWTYRQFDAVIDRTWRWLAAHGARPGLPIHLALANSPAFVAVWLAAVRHGGWVIPADPQSSSAELKMHFASTSPVVGVCASKRAEEYRSAAANEGLAVLEVDEEDTDLGWGPTSPASASRIPDPAPLDRAAVMFTSGSTAAPKGVVITQANYAFAGEVMAAAADLRAQDRTLVVLPLFHANAQYYSFAAAISAGSSVALMSRFSASGFLTQAARHRATHASLFAAPMRMILARCGSPVPGLQLRQCWYAQNVTAPQYEQFSALLGCRPRQLYGMTETLPAVLTNPSDSPEFNSMGAVTTGCRVKLRRSDGRAPAPGEVGEIVVGGEPGTTLFESYLDDPEATHAAVHEGWFYTGDYAVQDARGTFFFNGRAGDVLKVAGENVSVVEIESVLAEHPCVLEVAVVGEPDPIRDEIPIAFVVPASANLDIADLESWCRQRLAPSKRPRRIHVVERLPRTSVGKIRKFLLHGETANQLVSRES